MRRLLKIAGLTCAAAVVLIMVAVAIVLRPTERSPLWTEFAIGPASGISANIQSGAIRADGLTLKAAIALAYDVPPVRVIGPDWLAQVRYSVNAAVARDAAPSFRSVLREELDRRLRLRTHVELRPFDVLVLTADAPRLVPAPNDGFSAWIHEREARIQGGKMSDLASVLQSVIGQPVVDETGLDGAFSLDFDWGDDRLDDVTTVMAAKYGLRLAPARRPLEALIIDRIRRDIALVILEHVGRMSRPAPAGFRRHLAELLEVQ